MKDTVIAFASCVGALALLVLMATAVGAALGGLAGAAVWVFRFLAGV